MAAPERILLQTDILSSGEVVDMSVQRSLYFLGLNRTLQLVQGLALDHFYLPYQYFKLLVFNSR